MDLIGKKEGKLNLIEISLILVAVTMVFSNNLNSYSIIAFALVSLLSSPLRQKTGNLKQNLWSWVIPVSFFIWIVLNFLFDKSPARSTRLLDRNVSLLVFPIILGSMGSLGNKTIKRILLAFVMANIAGSLYCLYSAYKEYSGGNRFIVLFFYHNLSERIGLNAIYLSMYVLFSIIILIYYYFFTRESFKVRSLVALVLVYLTVIMVLLSSKMFIFLLGLSGICLIMYACIRHRRMWAGIISIVLFSGALFFLLNKFSFTKTRIEETRIKKYTGAGDNPNGVAVRGVIWKTAWNLVKQERGVLGMGQFTAQDSLRQGYLRAGFKNGADEDYNSHNQYLYTWLCYGYIGVVILLIFLLRVFLVFIQKKLFLGLALSLYFILANITECMLETHNGIVFFLFFSCLLMFNFTPGTHERTGAGERIAGLEN